MNTITKAKETVARMSEPDGRNAGISKTEGVIALAAATTAAFAARELLEAGWRKTLDRDPPKNPSSYEVTWKEAILWGAVSGAFIGVTRIASRRISSGAYSKWRS